jgi:hypothetical protein
LFNGMFLLYFRDTPTSAGPNSFNKGKRGFTHQRKVFEKKLNETKPP